MSTTRPAAVAGLFYPDNPTELKRTVTDLLADARGEASLHAPKALIVPHAGYIYSGAVAASAYARLGGLRGRIRRVVLLGPTHRVPVRGLALPEADRFATPLGEVQLDRAGMQAIAGLPQVVRSAAAHQMEHSLEVQLPFLQQVLGDFQLLPLAVGDATAAEVADVLETVWGGDETLIVISSDLSHFLPDALARQVDGAHRGRHPGAGFASQPRAGLRRHAGQRPAAGGAQAWPASGGAGRAQFQRHRRRPRAGGRLCRLRFSGRGRSRESRKVEADQAEAEKGSFLLKLARAEIARQLWEDVPEPSAEPWMAEPGASFVTLTRQGELRGCIGTLEAHRPLGMDVRENAVAAAFRDPRFMPLSRAEFDRVRVEVSLLSPHRTAGGCQRRGCDLDVLRPGIDGVVFEYGHFRSTFLPQVWEQLPDPAEFLAHLKRKAGLPLDFWAKEVRLSRYTVGKWKEQPHEQ